MVGAVGQALLVALMGVVNVLSAVTPALADRLAILSNYSPLVVRHGGHLTATLAGYALIVRLQPGAAQTGGLVLDANCPGRIHAQPPGKGLDYEEALLAGE